MNENMCLSYEHVLSYMAVIWHLNKTFWSHHNYNQSSFSTFYNENSTIDSYQNKKMSNDN